MAAKGKASPARPGRWRFQFFRDTIGELRKVVWPSRQEAMRLTTMVIAASLAVGIILGVIDYIFTKLLNGLLFRAP